MKKLLLALLPSVFFAVHVDAQSAIYSNDFGTSVIGNANIDTLTHTSIDGNLASAVWTYGTDGGSSVRLSDDNGGFLALAAGTTTPNTLDLAVSGGAYMQLTLTAEPGYQIDLTSVSFLAGGYGAGNGHSANAVLRSDANGDDFATNLLGALSVGGTQPLYDLTATEPDRYFLMNASFLDADNPTITYSFSEFDAGASVSLRFYVYDTYSGSNNRFSGIDDLSIIGEVSAVLATAPTITTPPAALTSVIGDPADFSVTASGTGTLLYQWQKDEVDIPGADASTYTIAAVQEADAGSYRVKVTDDNGSIFSAAAVLTVEASSSVAFIQNFSLRANVTGGEQVLILGYVLEGETNSDVLIRGVGPGLVQFVPNGTLADPQLELFARDTSLSSNDNWSTDDGSSLGAFALEASSHDAVLTASLPAGLYTTVLSPADSSTGLALAELYNRNPDSSIPLVNVSARSELPADDTLIMGICISGPGTRKLFVRVVGPTLANLGVVSAHTDPALEVFSRTDTEDVSIASNNDWEDNSDAAAISAAATVTGAFALPTGSKDAAVLVTLGAGNHTIHATSNDGSSGIVLMEIYVVE